MHVIPTVGVGGAEQVTLSLAQHAAAAGHDVSLVVSFRVDAPCREAESLHPGVRVEYVNAAAGFVLLRYVRALGWAWRNRSRLAGLDVVHGHLTYGAFVCLAIRTVLGLRSRRPTLVNTWHGVGGVTGWKRWANARLAACADGLALVASEPFWERFRATHRALHVRTIFNGSARRTEPVSPAARAAYRGQLGIPEECPLVVGTVSRLHAERRPWLFVEVAARIAAILGDRVHFVLAGDGPHAAQVHASIASHGLQGRVHVTGPLESPSLPLSVMSLYLTASAGSMPGIAALEAVLAGVPALAFQAVPGYEATPADWIWSTHEPHALAQKAAVLLRDPDAMRALGARQEQHARANHSVQIMAEAYYDFYSATVAARSGAWSLRPSLAGSSPDGGAREGVRAATPLRS
ncbi:MAG TPA: glycosyltransferase [Longimicrobium sp.]